jgi:hypothetical protein
VTVRVESRSFIGDECDSPSVTASATVHEQYSLGILEA